MNRLYLIETLSSSDDEEVFIEHDDILYDIDIDRCEETFDGFDTVYPAAIVLKKMAYENDN